MWAVFDWTHHTYVYDEEVEPAPGVGEILDEAVSRPLQQHLQDEDVGEDLVRVLQHRLDGPPLLDVNVLKSLNTMEHIVKSSSGRSAVCV